MQRPLAGRHQLLQMRHDRVEQVDGAVGPLGGEVARRTAAQILDQRRSRPAAAAAGRRSRTARRVTCGERPLDAVLVEIEQLRRQRPVGSGAEAGAGQRRLQPRLVVLADQRGAGLDGLAGQMVEADLAPPASR